MLIREIRQNKVVQYIAPIRLSMYTCWVTILYAFIEFNRHNMSLLNTFSAVSVSVDSESLSVGEDVGTVSVVLKSENPYVTAFSMLVVCEEVDPPQATGKTLLHVRILQFAILSCSFTSVTSHHCVVFLVLEPQNALHQSCN